MRKKYENPPINEVVIGAYLKDPILSMRVEHVGLFWQKLIDRFPKSMQNMTIGNVEIPADGEIFPMQRFWFISEDDAHLIQIQRNAILFNWRKRDNFYPHYEDIKREFDSIFSQFQSFAKDSFGVPHIGIAQCELTYINIIEDEDYFRTFADTTTVIPQHSSPLIEGFPPPQFNTAYAFQADKDIQLGVNIQSRRNANTQNDVLYFELRTTGPVPEGTKAAADAWLDRAHDVIGNTFNTLTNPEIQQKYWKVRED
jgi:uncharacterized protein (TIGR04255 family)